MTWNSHHQVLGPEDIFDMAGVQRFREGRPRKMIIFLIMFFGIKTGSKKNKRSLPGIEIIEVFG